MGLPDPCQLPLLGRLDLLGGVVAVGGGAASPLDSSAPGPGHAHEDLVDVRGGDDLREEGVAWADVEIVPLDSPRRRPGEQAECLLVGPCQLLEGDLGEPRHRLPEVGCQQLRHQQLVGLVGHDVRHLECQPAAPEGKAELEVGARVGPTARGHDPLPQDPCRVRRPGLVLLLATELHLPL
eukprot:5104683-Heterocapsa_arctica.AAC.1